METTQKQIVLGILAHVDSGKTTLSEAMLYRAGAIRKLGRVDHGDAFLDTDSLEKARGITIFSKQALLTAGNTAITLLDTPGHVDFSTETERTLQVLDYAVLVVSGTRAKPYRNAVAAVAALPCAHLCIREQDGPARHDPGTVTQPAEPPPWRGFCGFWHRACRPQRSTGAVR